MINYKKLTVDNLILLTVACDFAGVTIEPEGNKDDKAIKST